MKKFFQFAQQTVLLAAALLLSHCASVQTVSVSSIPKDRSRPVSAQVSRLIILGFNFDNDYVEPLVSELKNKCRGGMVSGILTKDEVISYPFVHKRIITASGYCEGVN